MILDTCFLIDFQREQKGRRPGSATRFLERHLQTPFDVSIVSVVEFLEGFESVAAGEVFLRNFRWLPLAPPVAAQASRIRRGLRLAGTLIGDFDILIAATAIESGLPLVTRDVGDFGRVAGLDLVDYRPSG